MPSSVTSIQKPGGHSLPRKSAQEKLQSVKVGQEFRSPGSGAVRQRRAGEPRFVGLYPLARREWTSVIRGLRPGFSCRLASAKVHV